jgi:hypothetical protein
MSDVRYRTPEETRARQVKPGEFILQILRDETKLAEVVEHATKLTSVGPGEDAFDAAFLFALFGRVGAIRNFNPNKCIFVSLLQALGWRYTPRSERPRPSDIVVLTRDTVVAQLGAVTRIGMRVVPHDGATFDGRVEYYAGATPFWVNTLQRECYWLRYG